MAYFAVWGWIGIVGLARWYGGAPHPVPWDVLPSGFGSYLSTTIVLFVVPNACLAVVFFADQKMGNACLLLATGVILLLDLMLWHHDTLYATSIRVAIALWLASMIYLLMSNRSFKPNPPRHAIAPDESTLISASDTTPGGPA
jgi:hypothetical protein